MKRLILIIVLLETIGCNNHKNNQSHDSGNPLEQTYSIIREDVDISLRKANLKIRLQRPMSKKELRTLAFNLKDERANYEKLWIFYYLPEQETEYGAWAISHFKPELELEIMGASGEAYKKMNDEKVSGEIIASWYDNDAMLPNKKFLVKEKEKLFMKSIYADNGLLGKGGQLIEEVFEKKQSNATRYDYENNHGEYYLIEENGNLSLYDNSGKFKEMKRLSIAEMEEKKY
ncbi:hypothetical protein [Flagellimonas amoyensis]|uniref:hypothetical protein n=1 Tax=Flagellimonas amoyensis TaxID=2169401 RepID=UPI000D393B31|nr:hypothetical protein [Allomuricauda amoyensis]